MIVYGIADILTCIVEAIAVFIIFNTYLEFRRNLPKWLAWAGAAALAALIYISNHFFSFGSLNVVCIILFSFAASFMFKGPVGIKILASILSFAVSAIIEVIVLFVMMALGGISAEEIIEIPNLRIIGIIISKLLYIITVKFICTKTKMKRRSYKLPANYWLLFFVTMLGSIGEILLIFFLQYHMQSEDFYIPSLIGSVFIACIFFFTLYMYEGMSIQSDKLRQSELQEQQLDDQVRHLNELIVAHGKIKNVSHDLKNHMIALKSYMQNNNCEGGIKYINAIADNADINSDIIDTGNTVADSIITAKRNLAKTKNIDFTARLDIPEALPINPSDCCILLGNALDNAIEAAEKSEGERFVDISMSYSNSTLMCKISNSSPDIYNPLLKTTKKDSVNHGIGMKNINDVLSKYGSMLDIEVENNKFTLSFILYNIA